MGDEQCRHSAVPVPVLRRRHVGWLDDAGRSMGHPIVSMSATVLPLVLASSRRRSDTKVDRKSKKSLFVLPVNPDEHGTSLSPTGTRQPLPQLEGKQPCP